MSRCNTCGSKECYECKHGKQRCECANCAAAAAQEVNDDLLARIEALEERVAQLENTRCTHDINDWGDGCRRCDAAITKEQG
jgi:hypothetical protein